MRYTKQKVITAIDDTIKALQDIKLGILLGDIPQSEYPALMKDLEGE